MNRPIFIVGLGQAVVLAGFVAGIVGRWFPLGIPGEWEWQRLANSIRVDSVALGIAALTVLGFAALAAVGARSLARPRSVVQEVAWVAALAVAAVLVQAVVQEGAPEGYGLAKWIFALQNKGSSGYASVARDEMAEGLASFLQQYPAWIEQQDSLHIGTHPPGLFVVARLNADLARTHPGLARWLVDHAPGSVRPAIRATQGTRGITREEAAASILTGAATLMLAALAVVPLYLVARAEGSASSAWTVATLWPLLPAVILFQPTADTAFPMLSTLAIAAARWSLLLNRREPRLMLAVGSGTILAIGMEFSLVFLVVGVVVAAIVGFAQTPCDWKARVWLMTAVGGGFIAATLAWWLATSANPLSIWWTNQIHHRQFYRDYPRSRFGWSWINLMESAVAIGIAPVVLAVSSPKIGRLLPAATWATLVLLAVLTISGRSLSEVARLWLPLFPPLLLAAGLAWERWGSSPALLAWTVALLGCQTMILQTLIQVVYPV